MNRQIKSGPLDTTGVLGNDEIGVANANAAGPTTFHSAPQPVFACVLPFFRNLAVVAGAVQRATHSRPTSPSKSVRLATYVPPIGLVAFGSWL